MKLHRSPTSLAILSLFIEVSCVSRINVARITAPAPTPAGAEHVLTEDATAAMAKGGVYYALPRTRLAAEVTAEREIFLPGKFAKYAPTCLGLAADEVQTQPSINFSLAGASLAAVPEPDPAQVFLIDIRGRYFETKTMNAKYAGGGVISSLAVESDDQSVAVALEALKAAAGLASKAASFAAAAGARQIPSNDTEKAKQEEAERNKPELKACAEYKALINERASRLKELSSVQTPTLEKVLRELDDAINAYRSYYFTGTTAKTTAQRRFAYLPQRSASTPSVLRFSEAGGVCSENASLLNGPGFPKRTATASGTSGYFDNLLKDLGLRENDYDNDDYKRAVLQIKKLQAMSAFQACACERPTESNPTPDQIKGAIAVCATRIRDGARRDITLPPGDNWSLPMPDREGPNNPAPPTDLLLNVTTLSGLGSVIAAAPAVRSTPGRTGLFYRLPASARISLNRSPREFGATTVEIAQLGAVVSLPNSTGGRKTAYTADFTPAGALQNFSINSTALLDKSLVATLQSTAESVMGTVDTLRQPAAAPNTLADLEKQRKILQERKLIIETERAIEQLLRPAGQP